MSSSWLIFVIFLLNLEFVSLIQMKDHQRPQFHAMPEKNWMNDPNGPVFYHGIYHLFYQYNPFGAVWGNMHWGHMVSEDMVHWKHLPIALAPDEEYDKDGVFSGSITILDDGLPLISYTGQTKIEVQCIAQPKNTSDPYLIEWVKSPLNPVIKSPPSGVNPADFRDDTTAWKGTDNQWKMLVGASLNGNGAALLYSSSNFTDWKYEHPLWINDQYGNMWECPDFFPSGKYYAFKISALPSREDLWGIGHYDEHKEIFSPLGKLVRCDYGEYYASKSFFDSSSNRQIVFGWVNEEDKNGPARGWQGVQTLPREIQIDEDLQWITAQPVKELESLRILPGFQLKQTIIKDNGILSIPLQGRQLEIIAEFQLPSTPTTQFGLRVLELANHSEFSSIFYESDQVWVNRDQSGTDGAKNAQGGALPMKPSDTTVTLHVFVDHSIVEVYAQKGRARITSRIYTDENHSHVSIFSSGSDVTLNSLQAWTLNTCWKN